MSLNPFLPDPARASRYGQIESDQGTSLRRAAAGVLDTPADPIDNLGGVVPARTVKALMEQFGLGDVREVMVALLGLAQERARPPISRFPVGAVGLEPETGDLILGANAEFPKTHLGLTLHGEGFVATRAFSRGHALSILAIGEAHPCAHCRQYLSEFNWAQDLHLIDPLGHDLTLAQLYPWPFDPDYLGQPGARPGAIAWPGLSTTAHGLATDLYARLEHAGARAHAPYSGCPAAVVITLSDGRTVAGSAIESVAFNPTIPPLQAALVDLIAHGYGYGDIVGAALGTMVGGKVDYARSTAELLAAIAPDIPLAIVDWQV